MADMVADMEVDMMVDMVTNMEVELVSELVSGVGKLGQTFSTQSLLGLRIFWALQLQKASVGSGIVSI